MGGKPIVHVPEKCAIYSEAEGKKINPSWPFIYGSQSVGNVTLLISRVCLETGIDGDNTDLP